MMKHPEYASDLFAKGLKVRWEVKSPPAKGA